MIRILAISPVQRILADASLSSALFAWSISRLIVLTLIVVGAHARYAGVDLIGARTLEVILAPATIVPALQTAAQAGDSAWYIGIARDGYERAPFEATHMHNWAFFPLWPLLLRLAHAATGEYALTGLLLANLFLLPALAVLHKLAVEWGFDEVSADRAVFYAAVFPTAHFYSLPLTESLFLLLTVGSFLAARRDMWPAAGLLGGLASATKVTGILLLPALLFVYCRRHGLRLRLNILALALIPCGLLSFMLFLHHVTGNAFAFRDVQAAWARSGNISNALVFWAVPAQYLLRPGTLARGWEFPALNCAATLMGFIAGALLIKRREYALGCYTLIATVLPLMSLVLRSMARYELVVFPIFLVLASACRSPRADATVRAIFLVLLALMAVLLGAGFSVAMS